MFLSESLRHTYNIHFNDDIFTLLTTSRLKCKVKKKGYILHSK